MKKIAIQGVKGCFHEQAARLFYEEHGQGVPDIVECLAFADLYKSMDKGEADAAVMAIENTVSGGLLPNFELLRKYDRKIKGEVFLRIQQNLMALPGQSIEDIKEVRTHYMAINQTREFFKDYPWIRLVESEDTAKSAHPQREYARRIPFNFASFSSENTETISFSETARSGSLFTK